MKNKISDLNNHLFSQLERLGDEDLTPEQIEQEVKRGQAIVAVADQLVKSAAIQLAAVKIAVESGYKIDPPSHLPMLEGRVEKKTVNGTAPKK